MKKAILFLLSVCLLTEVLYASNPSWQYVPGQTKYYMLIITAGKYGYDTEFFAQQGENLADIFVRYNIIPKDNLTLIKQCQTEQFKEYFEKIKKVAGKNDILFICYVTHGTGYDSDLNVSWLGFNVHRNPFSEIDALENDLLIKAFKSIAWMEFVCPVPLGKRIVNWSQTLESRTDTLYYEKGYPVTVEVAPFDSYGWRLLPEKDNMTVGEKCALIRERWYLKFDSDFDGKINYYDGKDCEDLNTDFKNIWASSCDSSIISDSLMSKEIFGLDIQVDHDQDKVKDNIFVLMTENGPRLVCDLNSGQNIHSFDNLAADLLDTDNDGFFNEGDLNNNGRTDDFIDFPSGIQLADRNIILEKILSELYNGFPGVIASLDFGCQGGDRIDNIDKGSLGFSYAQKFRTISGGCLMDFSDNLFELYQIKRFGKKEANLLEFFNMIRKDNYYCYLNDNGDGYATKGYWSATDSKNDGSFSYRIPLFNVDEQLTPVIENPEKPDTYKLYQNYPNPFNGTTTILYNLPEYSFVNLVVYNELGQQVEALVNKNQYPGNYKYEWDAKQYASGTYFYILQTNHFRDRKKMIYIK